MTNNNFSISFCLLLLLIFNIYVFQTKQNKKSQKIIEIVGIKQRKRVEMSKIIMEQS